jgi:uncharacterized membrane protein
MIPWYRQLLALIYGVGVVMIALWALEQGSGPYVILGVVGMSLMTLLLIFGVEVSEVRVGDYVMIDFTETSIRNSREEQDEDDE